MKNTNQFNDFSNLLEVDYSDRIKVFFNYPTNNRIKFVRHPNDSRLLVPFITYIGGITKEELVEVTQTLDFQSCIIRKSQRISFPFEAKISGLAFKALKTLVNQQNTNQES